MSRCLTCRQYECDEWCGQSPEEIFKEVLELRSELFNIKEKWGPGKIVELQAEVKRQSEELGKLKLENWNIAINQIPRYMADAVLAKQEIQRLRKIIEDAPHMPYCDCVSGGGYDCSCWKKGVLG